ncbi:DUF3397 domain-containing protein [Halobacillus sp. Marseille-Q1614]|uniref:DUF3397 domain-containing protein n=1 Tax=Halobacillus sp. Marseille-Q1614 TaxID=2709134 RepID=UPI00156EE1F9|nr:DUF3397 domain-containing protein [Halobacillus sp. Marseille-Q1614]
MSQFFIYTVAFIVTAPLFFLFILYFFSRKLYRNKRKAVRQTTQLMVPILILAVHVLFVVLFGKNYFPWIVVFLLGLLAFAMIIQYKIHEEVLIFKAFKSFLRLSFLFFTLAYVGLTLYGIIDRLFL